MNCRNKLCLMLFNRDKSTLEVFINNDNITEEAMDFESKNHNLKHDVNLKMDEICHYLVNLIYDKSKGIRA